MLEISKEDAQMIRKFEEILSKGYYANGGEVTELYNRVLEKRVASTNCGSCLKIRIQELVAALNKFEEQSKHDEVDNSSEEENKANREAGKAQKSKAIKKAK